MAKKTKSKKTTKRLRKSSLDNAKSFRIYPDDKPFIQFRFTNQTLYWTILSIVILIAALWILFMQIEALQTTESIGE